MVEALGEVPAWKALSAAPPRPETRFERRGLKKGHAVVDLFLERLP
jgi:tRNA G46 methylase TrmB